MIGMMAFQIGPGGGPSDAKPRSKLGWFLACVILFLVLAGTLYWRRQAVLQQAISILKGPIVTAFQLLYFKSEYQTWRGMSWMGTQILKNPMDLWVYQEIIYETKPDVIIDSGTYRGGSALFFASICDLLDRGRVISIDIYKREGMPQHKRIVYLLGSSTSPEVSSQIRSLLAPTDKVMVALDSDHKKEHVLRELRIYSQLVTVGNYLIVEDTILNGHPVWPDFGPGPAEAVEEFLRETQSFVVDKSREKHLLTFHPGGYLLRTR